MISRRSLLLLASLAIGANAQLRTITCPDQWSVDAADDPCNPFRYIPSLPANAIFSALYFIVAIILTYQHIRHRAKYMLCLVIGAYCEGLGLAFRLMVRNDVHSTGKYIVMYLFVVLSPCAFLAANYILLGRIVGHLDGNRYLRPLKANWVSWTFVLSDVFTFLMQAAGGSMTIIKDDKISNAGNKIFLAGIAIQAASFVIFTAMWGVFAYRVRYRDNVLWSRAGWKPLHWALGFTCIWFIIRSIFRTIELSQGYRGYLATHEIFVLCLDTLPLLIGIMVYCYFWPGKYLTPETKVESLDALQAEQDGAAQGGESATWRENGDLGLASLGKDGTVTGTENGQGAALGVNGAGDEISSVKSELRP